MKVEEGSGRFFEKKLRKKLLRLGSVQIKTLITPGQKFFAELRAPMTERKRGLNRAEALKVPAVRSAVGIALEGAQLSYKKATAFF